MYYTYHTYYRYLPHAILDISDGYWLPGTKATAAYGRVGNKKYILYVHTYVVRSSSYVLYVTCQQLDQVGEMDPELEGSQSVRWRI
jgi:hypothetical protein